jgi:hypothetical protein
MICSARPLACRSHLSYDRQACVDASAGRIDAVSYSVPHMQVRSLVQNALQSALRDAGYPWVVYEINQAVGVALADERAGPRWLAGEDIFAPARADEVMMAEMETTYDRLRGRSH